MKKLFAMLLALVLCPFAFASAEVIPDPQSLTGVLLSVNERELVVKTDTESVIVSISEETRFEVEKPLTAGDYVNVSWLSSTETGVMADVVSCYLFTGVVDQVGMVCDNDGNLIMHYFRLLPDTQEDPIHVNCSAEDVQRVTEGQRVTVYYNGMLSRSVPAMIFAQSIRGLTLEGEITAVEEDGSLRLHLSDRDEDVIIHMSSETLILTEVTVGSFVSAAVGPTMTLSLPAQYEALEILPLPLAREITVDCGMPE